MKEKFIKTENLLKKKTKLGKIQSKRKEIILYKKEKQTGTLLQNKKKTLKENKWKLLTK